MKLKGSISRETNLFIVLIVVMGLSVVGATIASSSFGARLVSLERQISQVEKENQEISSKLLNGTSLTQIAEKSKELGMVKPTTIIYINQNNPVASLK